MRGALPAHRLLPPVLDIHRLQAQFGDFAAYQQTARDQQQRRLEEAQAAWAACAPDWVALREEVQRATPSELVAGLRERPDAAHDPCERPTPITVVASDGSQIYPDRHVEPSCYLLNVSRIAFQYGTLDPPVMEAVPDFRYRTDEVDAHLDDLDQLFGEAASPEVVSALRDELELQALHDVATQAQVDGRPLVALADGTLIRWMLRGMRNRTLETRLIERYARLLAQFQADRLPLCSYISMPGNTEVVNLLRFTRGELATSTPPDDTLLGLRDRDLFGAHLQPGQRSALFESASRIQRDYGAQDRICYFYVAIPAGSGTAEIGRVEIPQWLTDDPVLVDLVHAVVLSECEKGDGYPMILSEAHERAVVRARERELFYHLVDEQMTRAGLNASGSRKQASKRRPVV